MVAEYVYIRRPTPVIKYVYYFIGCVLWTFRKADHPESVGKTLKPTRYFIGPLPEGAMSDPPPFYLRCRHKSRSCATLSSSWLIQLTTPPQQWTWRSPQNRSNPFEQFTESMLTSKFHILIVVGACCCDNQFRNILIRS